MGLLDRGGKIKWSQSRRTVKTFYTQRYQNYAVWAEDAEVLAVHMCSITGDSEGRILFRLI